MHRPGVAHKILPRPRMARKEVEREHIALKPITGTTSRDKVARIVRSAAGQRYHVIERGRAMIESLGAVHAALTAVAQRGAPHRLFCRHVGRHFWPK